MRTIRPMRGCRCWSVKLARWPTRKSARSADLRGRSGRALLWWRACGLGDARLCQHDGPIGQREVRASCLVEHRDAAVLHGDDPRGPQFAVVPVEVLDLLAGMQLPTRLDDAPWVGQQLIDHPAELVQLGTGSHRQLFDQLDAHGPILPTPPALVLRRPSAGLARGRCPPASRRPPRAATRRCGRSDGRRCALARSVGNAAG